MSVRARLDRLFGADRRCFNVAIDHGMFDEPAFLAGIENMPRAVQTIVDAGPDAIQLTAGEAPHLNQASGWPKPALVLRTDVANVYGPRLPATLFSVLDEGAVESGLRLDAACVVVNLLQLPDQPELHRQCLANIIRLKPQCERFGMPLMVEPLVMRPNEQAGGYMPDGNLPRILALVRQAVELGADVIKADPCDAVDEYHQVIEIAGGVPVLVRGGGRVSDVDILARTAAVMAQGASGIVYGRNVIQHPEPRRITQALMAVVHDGASPEAAQQLLAAPV